MKIGHITLTLLVAVLLTAVGTIILTPTIFAGRVSPRTVMGSVSLANVAHDDVPGMVDAYETAITNKTLKFQLRGKTVEHTLADLGISINTNKTSQSIITTTLLATVSRQSNIKPVIQINESTLNKELATSFQEDINPPINASLNLINNKLIDVPSEDGETINIETATKEITKAIHSEQWNTLITLDTIITSAEVQNDETQQARVFAEQLLKEGMEFTFKDQVFNMKPFTIQRLLSFTEQVDPSNHKNHILGVRLEPEGLANYLTTTIIPVINQEPENARFTLASGTEAPRVTQFGLPQNGQKLNIQKTASNIAARLAKHQRIIPLAVEVATPDVITLDDIQRHGITSLLAIGESDFVGSPKNRKINIDVGAKRYNGLLIPAGSEFSFNQHLGPVTKAAGFLPELVIKNNVTTPEYGGGLCQVSTTAFRAALNSGLEITDRRNHAYAVSYYGTPGLDATIYPPSTDLKFKNNTPSYILIQTRIEGTKIFFEFWGTDDGRKVAVDKPVLYEKHANGAVKAYVKQIVTKGEETLIDDTFYSRYKSPKLFPKVLAANGEAPTASPTISPSPTPLIKASPSPTKKPKNSPKPSPATP
jgi:vancomycin resistance protein YoaR